MSNVTPHSELRHTPMSDATPQLAAPYPNELRHTPMSHATQLIHATSKWATPRSMTSYVRHTPIGDATPQWAKMQLSNAKPRNELRHTPMSNTTPQWATLHPNKRCHTAMSNATTPGPIMSYVTPQLATLHHNEQRHTP